MAMFEKPVLTAADRAVRAVRREEFLPAEQKVRATEDTPLPIGFAQTISQPSLVAEMTRQLAINDRSRVLEIGTGSGYQTAILAEIAAEVFTIERVSELGEAARHRLDALGYTNIRFRLGDGALGWPESAPFDGIMLTAAPEKMPGTLVAQLAVGGRLVAPIGPRDDQKLVLLTKDERGGVSERELFGVRFVPLVSGRH